MEIKYDAYWKTDKDTTRITHGVLTEEDLEEAVRRKEDRESIDHMPVRFSSVNWDGVKL
jgi:hypothetical protein